jgi:membrane protein implicated in regulation of membrane protease activity
MQKILSWIIKVIGWALTIRELYILIAESVGGSVILTGIIYFFSHLPTWLLVILFICLAVMLFIGIGRLWGVIKRQKAKNTERLLIEDLNIEQDINGVKRAKGLEIENQDAEIRRTSVNMRVKNAEEVIGASFKQVNKTPLSTSLIVCECGERFSYTFTGNPPDEVKCPNCGKIYPIHH